MRLLESTALFSLMAAIALTLEGGASEIEVAPEHAVAWLDQVNDVLSNTSLEQRHDVVIEINDVEVARGYSRPTCDGLLLIARLPDNAQGWQHVAPQVDFSRYTVRYLFAGTVYKRTPVLSRLRSRLLDALPGTSGHRASIVAFAEAGQCDLTSLATTAVEALRWRRDRRDVGS
jgi:hypothetical protein